MAFLYLDAQSEDYRHLEAREQQPVPWAQLERACLTALSRHHLGEGWRDARERLASALDLPRRTHTDERIADAVRYLHEHPGDINNLIHIARRAGLSPSRFLHLFKKTTGVPFRRYRLWSRMGAAVRQLAKQSSLTEAALHAGFSSSSHFSAAFREMFGMSPSALRGFDFSIDEGREQPQR